MLYCYVKKQEVTMRHLCGPLLNWCIKNLNFVLQSRLLSLSKNHKSPFGSIVDEKWWQTKKKTSLRAAWENIFWICCIRSMPSSITAPPGVLWQCDSQTSGWKQLGTAERESLTAVSISHLAPGRRGRIGLVLLPFYLVSRASLETPKLSGIHFKTEAHHQIQWFPMPCALGCYNRV